MTTDWLGLQDAHEQKKQNTPFTNLTSCETHIPGARLHLIILDQAGNL
jgi:hypothetical protein